ncbi:MAG: hypothetical protein JWO02_2120 [Solirubrobacterales bacterium]|nr:hypothetical protein [Solirubrobacterales bacterium]
MSAAAERLHLVTRPGHPTFLDLPWHEPLETWEHERIVQVTRGIGRHVVRFVNYDGALYALKELPRRYAEREYRLLRHLAEESMPVVKSVGVVTGRGADLDAILVTRHLDFSIPYRTLFADDGGEELRSTLLTALAELLVRLHLTGFFWGDCSLSNTLFRRDAGGLSAYLVDAETGELHPSLTDGQREHDIALADEHVVGELLDLAGELERTVDLDPVETAAELRRRYEATWDELTREEVIHPDEQFRIDERLRRLNELGFDVEEIALEAVPEGYRLRLDPHVVEPGHHRRRLLMLTGLNAQENQARRMLASLAAFRARLEGEDGQPLPESVAAYRWRAEVFEPVVAAMPPEALVNHEAAEVFHEVLEHHWRLSERCGADVGLEEAVRSYAQKTQAASADAG